MMNKRIQILKMALKSIKKDSILNKLEAKQSGVLPGPVIAIGGAEDKSDHSKILRKVFEISGGKGIDITIVPWASQKKDRGEVYKKLFKKFGAKDIFLLDKESKKEALHAFEYSALIFFIGGDQKRLLESLERLDLIDEIRKHNKEGTTIAGTSAGASILGEHMPYYSDEKEEMTYYKGINLIPNSIIDQHFSQRNRLKRLQSGIKIFPNAIGYGIDEDTAIGFQDGKEIFQIGSGRIKILPDS